MVRKIYSRQRKCKQILEQRFANCKFASVRPDWLKNPETGRNLELDCYNEELKLALEYNGYQHYVFPSKWCKTKYKFDKLQERDAYKKKRCQEMGIRLIIIKYDVINLQSYIYTCLKDMK